MKFIAYSDHPAMDKEFFKNGKNWFIQYGDSDEI